MAAMAFQNTILTIVYSAVFSGTDQRNIKARHHWPLRGDFNDYRWIPLTKGR